MTVSLCIVARNEAHFIGRAIASAQALADQIVVVDTGSTDGTPEVARRAGAEVSLAAWPGDLGQAHDLPLELAKGDWILALDADEALDPSAAERLPVLTQGPADGYRFTVRNYDYRPALKWRSANPADPLTLGAPGWSPSWAVRLFRNDRRYRNRGRLHQSVHGAIVAAGGTVADTDIPIHHYGMLRFDRDKSSFYLQLAGAEAHDAAKSPRAWLELGVVQIVGRRYDVGARELRARVPTVGRIRPRRFILVDVSSMAMSWPRPPRCSRRRSARTVGTPRSISISPTPGKNWRVRVRRRAISRGLATPVARRSRRGQAAQSR